MKENGDLNCKSKEELIEIINQLKNTKISKGKQPKISQNNNNNNKKKNKKTSGFTMDKYCQRHVALKILYFGWEYYGFATQPEEAQQNRTIEVKPTNFF